jgi:hypothetical protein
VRPSGPSQDRLEAPVDGSGLIGSVAGMAMGIVLIFGGPILYIVLQVRTLIRWHGWWRALAVPPLLLMAGATALTVMGFREGSNLAPLSVIFGAPVALAWFGMVWAVRRQVLR